MSQITSGCVPGCSWHRRDLTALLVSGSAGGSSRGIPEGRLHVVAEGLRRAARNRGRVAVAGCMIPGHAARGSPSPLVTSSR